MALLQAPVPPARFLAPPANVLSLDSSTGESTTLSNTPSEGQVLNWAFGGVLEPYYIVACDDFPPDRRTVFDNVTVFDENLHPIADPKWSETFNSTVQPQCGYGVKTHTAQSKSLLLRGVLPLLSARY